MTRGRWQDGGHWSCPPTPGEAGADTGRAMATRDRDGRLRPGGSARKGGGVLARMSHPRASCCCPGGTPTPATGGGDGDMAAASDIPRQLCPSTRAGGERSSAQHHTHCAREYTGIARHRHRVATAPALHQHAWALHRHCMATAWTLPTACMGTALAPYGHCTSTTLALHGYCMDTAPAQLGHCIATATSMTWPPHQHRMAHHRHCMSTARALLQHAQPLHRHCTHGHCPGAVLQPEGMC